MKVLICSVVVAFPAVDAKAIAKLRHVVVWQATKNCAKKRAVRAARLFFLIQPLKSLICGVAVAVAFVIWKLKQGRRQRTRQRQKTMI